MRLATALASLALLASGPRVRFVDRAEPAGLEVETWSGGVEKNHILESAGNGVLLLDFDQDGFLDVYFVNAMRFLPGHKAEPHSNVLYRNRGDGTFVDVTREAGVGSSVFGAGGAITDYDNDGLPDIYVTNSTALSSPIREPSREPPTSRALPIRRSPAREWGTRDRTRVSPRTWTRSASRW